LCRLLLCAGALATAAGATPWWAPKALLHTHAAEEPTEEPTEEEPGDPSLRPAKFSAATPASPGVGLATVTGPPTVSTRQILAEYASSKIPVSMTCEEAGEQAQRAYNTAADLRAEIAAAVADQDRGAPRLQEAYAKSAQLGEIAQTATQLMRANYHNALQLLKTLEDTDPLGVGRGDKYEASDSLVDQIHDHLVGKTAVFSEAWANLRRQSKEAKIATNYLEILQAKESALRDHLGAAHDIGNQLGNELNCQERVEVTKDVLDQLESLASRVHTSDSARSQLAKYARVAHKS
jgi:hypothetical protein